MRVDKMTWLYFPYEMMVILFFFNGYINGWYFGKIN